MTSLMTPRHVFHPIIFQVVTSHDFDVFVRHFVALILIFLWRSVYVFWVRQVDVLRIRSSIYGVTALDAQDILASPHTFAPDLLCNCTEGFAGKGANCVECSGVAERSRPVFNATHGTCCGCPQGQAGAPHQSMFHFGFITMNHGRIVTQKANAESV